jgi:hypothetical protein
MARKKNLPPMPQFLPETAPAQPQPVPLAQVPLLKLDFRPLSETAPWRVKGCESLAAGTAPQYSGRAGTGADSSGLSAPVERLVTLDNEWDEGDGWSDRRQLERMNQGSKTSRDTNGHPAVGGQAKSKARPKNERAQARKLNAFF